MPGDLAGNDGRPDAAAKAPAGIDFLNGANGDAWRDLGDAAMTDQQVALEDSVLVSQAGVADA